MEINLKDGVFIVVYLVTVVTLWNGFRNDILNNKKDITGNSKDIQKLSELFKKVMFSESGDVLLTTKKDCNKTQSEIANKLEAGESATKDAFKKIEEINLNVIRIMCHLEIDETSVLYQNSILNQKGNND